MYGRYGISPSNAGLERIGRKQGQGFNSFYRTSNIAYEGSLRRGLEVSVIQNDEEVCPPLIAWYTMDVDVRRSGSGWLVRSRVIGPGMDSSAPWQENTLSLGEFDGTMPCGYCGLALWHLQSNIQQDVGILFRSFSASGLEYENCEAAPAPCVDGYQLVRILSIDRHPAHAKMEYQVIASAECPE
jgi:hypothetical protein